MCIRSSDIYQKGNVVSRFYGLRQESASKKVKLNTYGDMPKNLWKTFTKLASLVKTITQ